MRTTTEDGAGGRLAHPSQDGPRPEDAPRLAPDIDPPLRAVGSDEVDALFVSDATGRRLITLNGSDRAYRLLRTWPTALTLTPVSINPSVVDGLPEALCMVVTDATEQRRSEADSLSRQHLLEVIEDQQRTQKQLQESLGALRPRNRALSAISQGVLTLVPVEREAERSLFSGAIVHAKSPSSHRDVNLSREEAARLIVFASHLLGHRGAALADLTGAGGPASRRRLNNTLDVSRTISYGGER